MRARGHGAARRWAIVGALVAVLVATPPLIGALPASDAEVSAADLRAAVLGSADIGFSGYAESAGGLLLPVTDQLTSVADLFSDRTEMRVWWRGPTDHRVDVITAAGETSTHHDECGTWTWEYERATATRAESTPFALPAPSDLLPTSLGRRLLSEATDDELARIGARRCPATTPWDCAWCRTRGRRPSAGSTSGWTRQWPAAAGAGVREGDRPAGARHPVPRPRGRAARPPRSPPSPRRRGRASARRARPRSCSRRDGGSIPCRCPANWPACRAADRGGPARHRPVRPGVTLLAVAPVPQRLARGLRDAMAQSLDAVRDDAGTRLAAGPVGLMLVEPPGRGPYVLTGTVTLDALARPPAQLPGGAS